MRIHITIFAVLSLLLTVNLSYADESEFIEESAADIFAKECLKENFNLNMVFKSLESNNNYTNSRKIGNIDKGSLHRSDFSNLKNSVIVSLFRNTSGLIEQCTVFFKKNKKRNITKNKIAWVINEKDIIIKEFRKNKLTNLDVKYLGNHIELIDGHIMDDDLFQIVLTRKRDKPKKK